ncbi:reductase with NAD or NADP as acceptor [Salpingoeca rosetta]|uniref:Reductase with NAD or NADP as acceptor n=1 Tax=Salpingoeca rosetta (strain ATCC 50818 / BSB-021) TaxID=946362 RepID=F2UJP1_SALR5|nr:reductase with NAD or NADP as acceptor [Salpingoeca rosetta]EGD77340.1 reductase with NAD or NADP as acceptor [Salpingoeca rosetta]|eukprot:XP_004990684.1 reductase with NAD or NADP as acceptor [Salpingoeca rosetta]
MEFNDKLSIVQKKAAESVGKTLDGGVYVVTGGTGFVGQRLVEMLVERGADRVISFDIVPPTSLCWIHPKIEYVVGDITNKEQVIEACKGADCVYHIAAAVGPFHPYPLYERVNYQGTLHVIEACRVHNIPKLVMSSSPSTRFDGSDVDGLTEAQMPALPLPRYMQTYAETKAMGEMAVTAACSPSLMTVSVAPHQVYGPRDNLFMPNILEAAGTGVLRIFSARRTGYGMNKVCFTHVDNYCHGLMCAEKALFKNSPALGKFYIVTDGRTHPSPLGYAHFWQVLDEPIKAMGFPSIWSKFKLPVWLLMPIAHICDFIGWLTGRKLKLNPFNVRVLTMHRWFDISVAERDLKFTPIISFTDGWRDTADYFKEHWLPRFRTNRRVAGLAQQSEDKINIQARR